MLAYCSPSTLTSVSGPEPRNPLPALAILSKNMAVQRLKMMKVARIAHTSMRNQILPRKLMRAAAHKAHPCNSCRGQCASVVIHTAATISAHNAVAICWLMSARSGCNHACFIGHQHLTCKRPLRITSRHR